MSTKSLRCSVCLDDKPITYTTLDCDHIVCEECLTEHLLLFVESPQKDYYTIPCVMGRTECAGTYEALDIVPRVLPDKDTAHGWWYSVYQRTLMDSVGTCPYPDCGSVFELFTDNEEIANTTFAECFECHRGMCLKCESTWHEGLCSDETSREGRWQRHADDVERRRNKVNKREHSILVRRLAEKSGWTRCPRCNTMVEKKDGCLTVTCCCSAEFCYRCGALSDNHLCSKNCNFTLYDTDKLDDARKPMFDYSEASASSA